MEIEFLDTEPYALHECTISWLESIIISEGKKVGAVHFVITHDEKVLEVNRDFLQHDYYTDIITFDYCRGKVVSGDIYISLDRVKDNAMQFSVSIDKELSRVLAHGVLHLCGYKDKTQAEAQEMRSKEDFYLEKRSEMFG